MHEAWVAALEADFETKLLHHSQVGSGSTSIGHRCEFQSGRVVFVKSAGAAPKGMYEADLQVWSG